MSEVLNKNTSGGLLRFGSHVLKAWSSTQSVVALSSGEAEYYALLRGVSGGFGMRSVMNDMRIYPEVTAATYCTAAKGLAARRGLGKTRHMEVCYLWLQDMVDRGGSECTRSQETPTPRI